MTGVYHVEMSGYVAPGNDKQITILEDYVNQPLTNFLKVRATSDLAIFWRLQILPPPYIQFSNDITSNYTIFYFNPNRTY